MKNTNICTGLKNKINNSSATKAQKSVATTAVPAIQNCNCNSVYTVFQLKSDCRDVAILVLINIIAVLACKWL